MSTACLLKPRNQKKTRTYREKHIQNQNNRYVEGMEIAHDVEIGRKTRIDDKLVS